MPQVGSEQGQFGFDVGAGAVPSQQSINRKAVTKIVNSGRCSLRGYDVTFFQQRTDTASQASGSPQHTMTRLK